MKVKMSGYSTVRPTSFAIFAALLVTTQLLINQINAAAVNTEKSPVLNVAVIGAGTSGKVLFLVLTVLSVLQDYIIAILFSN